jgi:hypothetical protein
VEICKLRLFLKLVAQLDTVAELEPLPDVDFNIRAGNTLVGFVTREELDAARPGVLDFDGQADRVAARAASVDRAFSAFQVMQLARAVDSTALAAAKASLRGGLADLRGELDTYLASEYGLSERQPRALAAWQATHSPFHWIVEFFGLMSRGGFDVVLGNPPYVEYHKVKGTYAVHDYETLSCGNIYAFMLERSVKLARAGAHVGMIVPVSIVCTSRMAPLRAFLEGGRARVTAYDMRPSSLFEGVAQRLCIVLLEPHATERGLLTGGYRRWTAKERPALIDTTRYVELAIPAPGRPIPKVALPIETAILAKLGNGSLGTLQDHSAKPIYVHRIVRYFVKALDFVPRFVDASGRAGRSKDYKPFQFRADTRPMVTALLNSSLFYWYWRTHGDGFHCGYGDVFEFPSEHLTSEGRPVFEKLVRRLMDGYRINSTDKSIAAKTGTIRYQEFYPRESKSAIDEIDTVLAEHFALSSEELDFLVNYDIKYRVGTDGEDPGTDEEDPE